MTRVEKEEQESQKDIEIVNKLIDAAFNKDWKTIETLLFDPNLNKSKIALYSSGITTFLLTSGRAHDLAGFCDFLYEVSDNETALKAFQ